jgi:hypothetical protein
MLGRTASSRPWTISDASRIKTTPAEIFATPLHSVTVYLKFYTSMLTLSVPRPYIYGFEKQLYIYGLEKPA